MTTHIARPEHEVLYQELVEILRRHEGLKPIELLAVASNMVGKILAMQDQRTTTVDIAMRTISANIERGNQAVIEQLLNSTASKT